MSYWKEQKAQSTRQAFGESLVTLAAQDSQIVVLDADLSKSTKSELFAKKYPDQFFEMGIAEANMIGTAAGLSFTGRKPFACSFGCFLTGRYDIIRMSVAYAQARVCLVGTHAGLGVGEDGWSQMGLEDLSLMRSLPTMQVFQPMDSQETADLLQQLLQDWKGPSYLRLTRQNVPQVFFPNRVFQKGRLLRLPSLLEATAPNTKRVGCLASGAGVGLSLEAMLLLAASGIDLQVWNVHCLKPFDHENFHHQVISHCDLLITLEDHSILGGLGSVVAEALSEHPSHPPLIRFGVQDIFGESGTLEALYEKFGLSPSLIAHRVLSFFSK